MTLKADILRISGIPIPVISGNTLVIGSGAAGLNAALQLTRLGQSDVVIATEGRSAGASQNAGSDKQTYYKLGLGAGSTDSISALAKDLFNGRCMHGDIALCEAQNSVAAFMNLVSLGVPFPFDRFGAYPGYQTDNDNAYRATTAGPLTSKIMCQKLAAAVDEAAIPIYDHHQVIALLYRGEWDQRSVCGAIALDHSTINEENRGLVLFNMTNVIIATGGPGGLFANTVYPESQNGGIGLGLEIGAMAGNLTEFQFGIASLAPRWNLSGSYQQAMPRYVSTNSSGDDARDFLTPYFFNQIEMMEAIFLKGYQWPFAVDREGGLGSSLIDLLIYNETVVNGRRVWLDYTQNPQMGSEDSQFETNKLPESVYTYLSRSNALGSTPIERLDQLNLLAVEFYRSHGVDLAREWLEVGVCAQHCNGGLIANPWWESNIRHLFPIGEVNGSHGVHRPGGAALNAGQVGGIRAAQYINCHYCGEPDSIADFSSMVNERVTGLITFIEQVTSNGDGLELRTPDQIIGEVGKTMSRIAGIIRSLDPVEAELSATTDWLTRLPFEMRASVAELPKVFKAIDLLWTRQAVLSSIKAYIENGGASRGSFIISDDTVNSVDDPLHLEAARWTTTPGDVVEQHVHVVYCDPAGDVFISLVPIRPVPDPAIWFEQAWRDYQEGRVIR
jgi:succinate dehydrogenase/fumarate reductase flavoprotein subunit